MLASILPRPWRSAPSSAPFRPLSTMLAHWARCALESADRWPGPGLLRHGLELFRELPASSQAELLLATDLHAGNVLRARRAPWLAIDPKPFVGDPAYDATQHLFNCRDRMFGNPVGTLTNFAHRLGLEPERVRLWTFARADGTWILRFRADVGGQRTNGCNLGPPREH